MKFGNELTVALPFEKAREVTIAEFEKDGFGLLTEINVRETLKKKLDVDFRPYAILGMCNPPFAHQALSRVEAVGLLMPCNVVVYDNENGTCTISAMDIETIMNNFVPQLADLADEVGARVNAAMSRIAEAHSK